MENAAKVAYRVFLSYRRTDAWGWAAAICQRLRETFGADKVFMDVDDIDAGGDFRAVIVRTVAGCDVVLLIIGANWLSQVDAEGRPKLDSREDLVRIELETALKNEVAILPVLVEGGSMPEMESLPEALAPVASINAFDLQPKNFSRDIIRLEKRVRTELDAAEQRRHAPERIEDRLRQIKEQRVELDREESALKIQLETRILRDEREFQAEIASGAPRINQRGEPRRPYGAFMLYSHAGDLRLARELQRRLEEFGRAAGSRLKLFRDETDLAATPNIWSSISAALERSENLVLLASPASANSMWVHRELEYWFDNGRAADRVLIVLSEGEIVWDNQSNDFDWSRTTALPALLQGKFDGEPLYVDLRWWNGIEDTTRMEFQGSVASLAAAIQGRAKSELVSAIRRRRMKRRMTVASAIIVFLTFVFIAFIIFIKGG